MWQEYSRATFLHVNRFRSETSSRAGQSPLDSDPTRLLRMESGPKALTKGSQSSGTSPQLMLSLARLYLCAAVQLSTAVEMAVDILPPDAWGSRAP